MIFAVLDSGPSMSKSVAYYVRGKCSVVAVSDAYRLAPWCDAIASTDAAWWKAHPVALAMRCKKYGIVHDFQGVKGVETLHIETGTNSGLLGVMVAVKMGATKVLMCGFDLHSPGDHFFGKHPEPLKSTTAPRMEVFKKQFACYRPKGIEIINCTPGSALTC